MLLAEAPAQALSTCGRELGLASTYMQRYIFRPKCVDLMRLAPDPSRFLQAEDVAEAGARVIQVSLDFEGWRYMSVLERSLSTCFAA